MSRLGRRSSIATAMRISIGLVGLLASLLLALPVLQLDSTEAQAEAARRRSLCESVAMIIASAVSHGQTDQLPARLTEWIDENPALVGLTLKSHDGKLDYHQGSVPAEDSEQAEGDASADRVALPFTADGRPWGVLQLQFAPMVTGGWLSFLEGRTLRRLLIILAIGTPLLLLVTFLVLRRLMRSASQVPQRVRRTLNTLAEGVLLLDAREQVVFANTSFADTVGSEPAKLEGRHAGELGLTHRQDSGASKDPWKASCGEGATVIGVPMSVRSGKDGRALLVNAAPIENDAGNLAGALVSCDDVTVLEKLNAELEKFIQVLSWQRDEIEKRNRELNRLARHDPLTGCLNRRSFFEDFEDEFTAAKRGGVPLACIMIDVDFFKKINDNHGHSMGDAVLVAVAHAIQKSGRAADRMCRYGGEEFCLIIRAANVDEARLAGDRFRKVVENLVIGELRVTASVGVSVIDPRIALPKDLIDRADEALYVAKRRGRNRVMCWNDGLPATETEAQPGERVR